MHWFIDPIKNHYADFNGRVGRQEYWMFVLFSCLLSFAFEIASLETISVLVSLALFVPSIALASRRLHDTGRSGWWQLLWLIPIVGWIILIVWLATKTETTDNAYGVPAVPKTDPEGVPAAASAATAAAPVATQTDSSVPETGTVNSKIDDMPGATADSNSDTAASADGSSGFSSD